MKLNPKVGLKGSRQNKFFARNAGSTRGATKESRIHRIREKSIDRTTTRKSQQAASWHKDVETLIKSVERAWVAAERMQAAVEKPRPRNLRFRGRIVKDVF